MQISTSLQSAFTPTPATEVSKSTQASTLQPDTTAQTTDTINKDAYNYFSLGQDIGLYTNIDPIQEQTNKDVVNYLTKIMDETTAEGKKNLGAFGTERYNAFNMEDVSKHYNAQIEAEKKSPTTTTTNSSENSILDMLHFPPDHIYTTAEIDTAIKNYTPPPMNITHVADGLNFITVEEANKRDIERFKNLYSFSDEFSKTDKFQELYAKYKVQADKQKETLVPLAGNFQEVVHTTDMKGYITSEVVKQGFSKSEFIEHFSNISKDLKNIFSTTAETLSSSSTQAIKDSIKLYDKITADLKDMWGYGDLNVRA